MRPVAIDMAERAEIERAEGLDAVSRGFDHIARRVDLIVQYDKDALAARFGAARDAQCVDKVHAGIRAEGAGGALGPDQDDRLPDAQGEVQEKRRLFERRRAMRDDKT